LIASLGRIVEYTLTEQDADAINKRRRDGETSGIAHENSGAVVHKGNSVSADQKFPLVMTRVWNESTVNGQVLLDGNDTLWVMSRSAGDGDPGTWREFPKV
jgi:hypothetical protein